MARVPKVEGVKQRLRDDRLTEFGDRLRERVPGPKLSRGVGVGSRGRRAFDRKVRLDRVWAEADAEAAQ